MVAMTPAMACLLAQEESRQRMLRRQREADHAKKQADKREQAWRDLEPNTPWSIDADGRVGTRADEDGDVREWEPPEQKPDWRKLHWKQQVRMAKDMGADVTTATQARQWLEANA